MKYERGKSFLFGQNRAKVARVREDGVIDIVFLSGGTYVCDCFTLDADGNLQSLFPNEFGMRVTPQHHHFDIAQELARETGVPNSYAPQPTRKRSGGGLPGRRMTRR